MGLNPMILRQRRAFAFLVSPSVHPAAPRRPTARAVSFLGGKRAYNGRLGMDRSAAPKPTFHRERDIRFTALSGSSNAPVRRGEAELRL